MNILDEVKRLRELLEKANEPECEVRGHPNCRDSTGRMWVRVRHAKIDIHNSIETSLPRLLDRIEELLGFVDLYSLAHTAGCLTRTGGACDCGYRQAKFLKDKWTEPEQERTMPDISMCAQSECPKASKCYRFRAVPGHWQSYITPKFNENGCDHFWKVKPQDGVRSLSQIRRIKIQKPEQGEGGGGADASRKD